MPSVSLSFKVHIPYPLRKMSPGAVYISDYSGRSESCEALNKLATESWLPANRLLLALIRKYEGKFRIAFSISAVTLELLQEYRPDVVRSFKRLAATGCVEFFAETSHNTLCWLYSKNEFRQQVEKHHQLISTLFGQEPSVFRNTELIYQNELASLIAGLGYKGILCEGQDSILKGRNCNDIYASPGNGDFSVLLRNTRLSNDLAFHFDDPAWNEAPLTAEKFAGWIHGQENINCINLFLDYSTFGIHKKKGTGIFAFLEHLPSAILSHHQWRFVTPSEAVDSFYPKDLYDAPEIISWYEKGMGGFVWEENAMQHNALRKIYSLEAMVKQNALPAATECWRRLLSVDHFLHLRKSNTENGNGEQSPESFTDPEEAFQQYMNIVTDFEIGLIKKGLKDIKASCHQPVVNNLY